MGNLYSLYLFIVYLQNVQSYLIKLLLYNQQKYKYLFIILYYNSIMYNLSCFELGIYIRKCNIIILYKYNIILLFIFYY